MLEELHSSSCLRMAVIYHNIGWEFMSMVRGRDGHFSGWCNTFYGPLALGFGSLPPFSSSALPRLPQCKTQSRGTNTEMMTDADGLLERVEQIMSSSGGVLLVLSKTREISTPDQKHTTAPPSSWSLIVRKPCNSVVPARPVSGNK